jgi:hypothetical protein
MRKWIAYGGAFLTSIFGGKVAAQELITPELCEMSNLVVSGQDRKSQTEDVVIVNVGGNAQQNASNLEEASRVDTGGRLLTVILPNANYDKAGRDVISLNHRGNVVFKGLVNPVPSHPMLFNNYPVNAPIIRDEVDLPSSCTLEHLVFWANADSGNWFVDIKRDGTMIKNCYFIGDKSKPIQRAISRSTSYMVSTTTVEGCYMRDFKLGFDVGDTNTRWRGNIIRDCDYGFIGNAGTDLGTLASPGNNLFFRTRKIARLCYGSGYPMQWGYFYNLDGRQLKSLADIKSLIEDLRTTESSLMSETNVGSDVLLEPFYTTPHPLLPWSSGVRSWRMYR